MERVENTPDLWSEHLPRPEPGVHKYGRGYVTIFGAPSLTGATRLAASAASRAGAGLVCVQTQTRGDVYRASLPSDMMVRDEDDAIPDKTTALLGGSGGISPTHADFLMSAIDTVRVIDGGAFPDTPKALNGNEHTILTPHHGEFARLFGEIDTGDNRAALRAAEQASAIVVLKGPKTLIAHPAGRVIVHDRPDPNLAIAGTGDVLAGLIAGLAAQAMPPLYAAAAGVWMHSEAAQQIGRGLIASDIAGQIPKILKKLDWNLPDK